MRALWQVLRTKAHKLIDRVRRRPPLHPAAATKVVQDISPFNFLALPPELREAIYERTLIRRGPRHLDVHIDPTTKCFERPRVVFEDLPNISLLLASKQVQEEYWQIVKRHTTVNVISEGTWDLSRLAEWLPHGVTLPLLKQLQSWTITLMYCSWANSARRHLYTDPRYWDAQVVGIGQPRRF